MKTKVFIASIITMFIILISSCAYAATGTADFKLSVNQVKKGDTFTVTLSATSEDGINGVDTKYTYDQQKLELVSENVLNSSNWVSLGTSPDITVICNSTQTIKNADIYALTFKVKDNVSVGDKITIKTNEILLDTDAQENSEVKIAAKNAEVTVIESSSEKPKDDEPSSKDDEPEKKDEPSKVDDKTEEQEKTDSNIDDRQEEKKSETKKDSTQISDSQENQVKTITTDSDKVNEVTSSNKLPKTGSNYIITTISIIVIAILGIVFYRKYRKLNI